MQKSYLPAALVGLAGGILLALFIAPSTRVFVHRQWAVNLHMRPIISDPTMQWRNEVRRIAAAHPGDYQIQMAAILDETGMGAGSADAMKPLEPRFANRPSIYANILRYRVMKSTWMHSDAQWALTGSNRPDDFDDNVHPPDAQELADFDRDAAKGEYLDPQNAYFPLMRAVGYYTAHRNDYAQAAILRAGKKPAFREYMEDQIEGQWKIDSVSGGGPEAVQRVGIAAALPLPELRSLRDLSFQATYDCAVMEQQGRIAQGLALRRALMHCGSVMQGQCTTLIGCLVGSRIGFIAMDRPGGAPSAKPPGTSFADETDPYVAAFQTYVTKNGAPSLAGLASSLVDRNVQISHVGADIRSDRKGDATYANFSNVVKWLTADTAIVATLIELLCLAAISLLAGELLRAVLRVAIRPLALLLAATLVAALIGGVLVWQASATGSIASDCTRLVPSGETNGTSIMLGAYASVAAAPVALFVMAALLAIQAREANWAGVLRRFRMGAWVTSCLLCIAYAGCIMVTTQCEDKLIDAFNQSIAMGEGQYVAKLAGLPWPS